MARGKARLHCRELEYQTKKVDFYHGGTEEPLKDFKQEGNTISLIFTKDLPVSCGVRET